MFSTILTLLMLVAIHLPCFFQMCYFITLSKFFFFSSFCLSVFLNWFILNFKVFNLKIFICLHILSNDPYSYISIFLSEQYFSSDDFIVFLHPAKMYISSVLAKKNFTTSYFFFFFFFTCFLLLFQSK